MSGGEERIRTSDTLRYTVFPGPRTRPTMRPLRMRQAEIYSMEGKLTIVVWKRGSKEKTLSGRVQGWGQIERKCFLLLDRRRVVGDVEIIGKERSRYVAY